MEALTGGNCIKPRYWICRYGLFAVAEVLETHTWESAEQLGVAAAAVVVGFGDRIVPDLSWGVVGKRGLAVVFAVAVAVIAVAGVQKLAAGMYLAV